MKNPFFSILLPTKNRANLIGYAIQSVLNQSFKEFELIIVDNDDTSETSVAVSRFKDERIRYYRTGGLNMSENWEFALDQMQGQYVTVLEDKQAYYPWALNDMAESLRVTTTDVLIWHWDVFDAIRGKAYQRRRTGEWNRCRTDNILNLYVKKPSTAWSFLPRMLNSCVSTKIIQKIKKHPKVERFFNEFSPDLCAAFYLLAYVEEIVLLDKSMGLVGYQHLSNAKKVAKGGDECAKYYGIEKNHEHAVDNVPVKSMTLIHNTVYNDFVKIKKDIGGRLLKYKMDHDTYAMLCLSDVARNLVHGAAIYDDLRRIVTVFGYADIKFWIMACVHFSREVIRNAATQARRKWMLCWGSSDVIKVVDGKNIYQAVLNAKEHYGNPS